MRHTQVETVETTETVVTSGELYSVRVQLVYSIHSIVLLVMMNV